MNEDARPNPDALLARIRREERQENHGRLKLFLGAAPGVGKTYAMLAAAHRLVDEGVDVVVGYVEDHGRKETHALVDGLEVIPRQNVRQGELLLEEFDLDAALKRRPRLILVDELAHTNVRGCRHEKRYQDVLELLDEGIDVYTTVNVQHLESVSTIVEQVTGIRVRETLPDFVLNRADDIELIDLPPDELQERLRAGKVYAPEVAERALKNYFTEGNLIALRELALRKAASRVEADLLEFRRQHEITDAWPAAERLLVCVGPSPLSGKVIRTTGRIAESLRAEWMAVTVETPQYVKPNDASRERVLEHLRLADSLGAETRSLIGSTVANAVLEFARANNVTMIVIGKPTHPRWKDRLKGSLVDDIIRGSGAIEVHVVTSGPTAEKSSAKISLPPLQKIGLDLLLALMVGALGTFGSWLLDGYVTDSDQVMIFLVGVLLVAYRGSLQAALLTSFVCAACFDFFFIEPFYTFHVEDTRYLLTFAVMGTFGALVSGLVWRVRSQAETAKARQTVNAQLFEITRRLVTCESVKEICETGARHLNSTFNVDVSVFVGQSTDLKLMASAGVPLDEKGEWVTARWVHQHGLKAGVGTSTLPGVAGFYLPMRGPEMVLGVIGLRVEENRAFADPEKRDLLENIVAQMSQAIERLTFFTSSHQAVVALESERLRNSLLSSISHDVRTPVAGIMGSAELLMEHADGIDSTRRVMLVESIYKEASRLQRLVENLLEITRLEGGVALKREWHLLEEIVGAALNHVEPLLAGREVRTELSQELVYLDTSIVTTAVRNLVENAAKYSPTDSPILVRGYVSGSEAIFSVLDRGIGIKSGEENTLFEKFFRGTNVGRVAGSGLGLAIVRAAAEVHKGRTFARPRVDGAGAEIGFTVDQSGAPALPLLDDESI